MYIVIDGKENLVLATFAHKEHAEQMKERWKNVIIVEQNLLYSNEIILNVVFNFKHETVVAFPNEQEAEKFKNEHRKHYYFKKTV